MSVAKIYQRAVSLFVLWSCVSLYATAVPAGAPLSPTGAVVENWEFPHYDRLEGVGRSEVLHLLRQTSDHLKTDEGKVVDQARLAALLEPLVQSEDEEVAIASLQTLLLLDAEPISRTFTALDGVVRSDQRSKVVRGLALQALYGCRGRKDIIPTLGVVLGDEDLEMRFWAATALATLGPQHADQVLPVVTPALDSPDYRKDALAALSLLGKDASAALPALEALQKKMFQEGASREDLQEVDAVLHQVRGR